MDDKLLVLAREDAMEARLDMLMMGLLCLLCLLARIDTPMMGLLPPKAAPQGDDGPAGLAGSLAWKGAVDTVWPQNYGIELA